MAKGISIHIGLNTVDPVHYAGWSGPLNACEADAEDLQELASKLGYDTSILKTQDATCAAIVDALTAAAGVLVAGDILLVTYSGHGGQLPDQNGDEPEDMLDETWCLYDGQLIDDELNALYALIPAGVRVLVLSDSCHSGTVTRFARAASGRGYELATVDLASASSNDDTLRPRAAPRDALLRTYRQNRKAYDERAARVARKPAVSATVRLLSGCQDNQLSWDGTFNGLFTGTLLRVWNDGRFTGDYRTFHQRIVARMPAEQTPNHYVIGPSDAAFDLQRPFSIE